MSLSHNEAQELLQSRLEGALPPEQQALLVEHLAACPDCQAFQTCLNDLHHSLPAALASAWPHISLSHSELERKLAIHQQRIRRMNMNAHISSLARQAGGVVAIALLVLALVLIMKTIPGSPVSPGSAPTSTGENTPVENTLGKSSPVPQIPQEYTSPQTGLSWTVPAGWQAQGVDAFHGPDGFLQLTPFSEQAASLETACSLEVNLHPEYYGATPVVQWTVFEPVEACLILTSLNQADTARSAVVLQYPKAGQYLALYTDPAHLETILPSLKFPGNLAANPSSTQPPVDLNPPVSQANQESQVIGSLILDDYSIVSQEVDAPTHFEFLKRIPSFVLDQRSPWRQADIHYQAEQANQVLQSLGYSLQPELWSSVSPDIYALYQGDQVVQADIASFRQPAANSSMTDFALVVDTINGGSLLIQKDKSEAWDPMLHANTTPAYTGDDLVTVNINRSNQAGLSEQVQVVKNGQVIYTFIAAGSPVEEPVKMLGAYDGKWVLEVAGVLIEDGQILNRELGYAEVFNWQLLAGKPFYFFSKDGKIGLSYDGQVLPVQYDQVIHYACCEPAAFNPASYPDLVRFYALKDGIWRYVELGDYHQMPSLEPTPTPIPSPSDVCHQSGASVYEDTQGRFCFAYPPSFQMGEVAPGQPGLFSPPSGDSPEPLRANLALDIQPLQIETDLQTAVDVFLTQFSTDLASGVTRSDLMLGNEPAIVLDNVPGQVGSRDVFVLHGNFLYHLVFSPSVEAAPQMRVEVEELYQKVVSSFTFLK